MKETRGFECAPESVPEARRFAAEALQRLPAEALDSVTLMVSEVATNCIRHADSGFDLTISQSEGEIRIEATDRGGGEPRVRSPGPSDVSGRGLQIVDLLSTAWGWERLPGRGKTVWFTVAPGVPCAIG